MEIKTKYQLDQLTTYGVSVLKQEFINHNGEEKQVGENWRCAYINSMQGRIDIAELLKGEAELDAVMALWGDTPTISEEGGEYKND